MTCAAETKVRETISGMRQRIEHGEPAAAGDNRLGLDAAEWLLGALDVTRGKVEGRGKLQGELRHRREQSRALQARCSELLSQRRGIRYLVHDFHSRFGYAVHETPHVPEDDIVRFRLALIAEEFFELLEASVVDPGGIALAQSLISKALNGERYGIPLAKVAVDLPEFTDAMADLDYVVEGTRLAFGIDGWPVLLEVQRANMDKAPSHLASADRAKVDLNVAKTPKPEGWRPPDIAGELRKQGWDG